MGQELREAQQAPPTPDAEYWRGQAQLLHAQLHGLYDFAGRDEMRMQSELRHFQDVAEGESVAARWKVAASEQKAQHLAHKTAETAVAGSEWRSRRDAEWLKTRLQACEEQRSKLTGLSEHYKNLACKQLDQIQENNAQMTSQRATISADEAKINFLENGNGWLVQKLRTTEEQEAHLASILPEAHAENRELSSALGRTEETLSEVEARETTGVESSEQRYAALREDADGLRGEVWDVTNASAIAEVEMNAMLESTAAVRAKYKGVEDRKTRLAMLEEANKQLRMKMDGNTKGKEEQDLVVDELNKANNRLKKRLNEASKKNSQDASDISDVQLEAEGLQIENSELREELIEVTMVLERVGNSPGVPPQIEQIALSLDSPTHRPPPQPLSQQTVDAITVRTMQQQLGLRPTDPSALVQSWSGMPSASSPPMALPVFAGSSELQQAQLAQVHQVQQAQVLSPAEPPADFNGQMQDVMQSLRIGSELPGGQGPTLRQGVVAHAPGLVGSNGNDRLFAAMKNVQTVTRAMSPGSLSPESYAAQRRGPPPGMGR